MIQQTLEKIAIIERLFQDHILESNYVRVDNKVTWPDFRNTGRKSLYAREYQELLNSRQFTFLFEDKSFIQMYYSFNGNDLTEAKLCYYPYPVQLKEGKYELEIYFNEANSDMISRYYYDMWNIMNSELGFKLNEQQLIETAKYFEDKYNIVVDYNDFQLQYFDDVYWLSNYSHFRMDYDCQVTTHHKCEFQFGAIKNIRLPLNRILEPMIFIDFIARYFFKPFYSSLLTYKYKKNFLEAKHNCTIIDDFKENSFFNTLL